MYIIYFDTVRTMYVPDWRLTRPGINIPGDERTRGPTSKILYLYALPTGARSISLERCMYTGMRGEDLS